MIIKYTDMKATTHIFENVCQPTIYSNFDPERHFGIERIDCDYKEVPELVSYKVISYWDDKVNKPFLLYVYNVAYICNNDGKTIEKVFVR